MTLVTARGPYGLPSRVSAEGELLSEGWDIEFASQDRFFAAAQPCTAGAVQVHDGWVIDLGAGSVHLQSRIAGTGDEFNRWQQLEAHDHVLLQDFVARFKFPRSSFPHAELAGRAFVHTGENVWHQYPTGRVTLHGPRHRVDLRASSTTTGGGHGTRLDMYVRDEPGPWWIVHARLMPDPIEHLWLRWDTRFGRVIDVRSDSLLRALRRMPAAARLWYLAERRGGRPNAQLMGLLPLAPGQRLDLAVSVRFEVLRAG